MTLDEFLNMARATKLIPEEDLVAFAEDWRWHFDRGDPDFGTETTTEDWMGGIEAWRALKVLGLAMRRQGLA